jgi:hypothetical protein
LRAYRAFHEAGVPFAIRDGALLVRQLEAGDDFTVEVPRWLFEAMCDAVKVPTSSGMGRNAKPTSVARENNLRLGRYFYILELQEKPEENGKKLTLDAAFVRASEENRGKYIAGSEATFRNSYFRVKRAFDKGIGIDVYYPYSDQDLGF